MTKGHIGLLLGVGGGGGDFRYGTSPSIPVKSLRFEQQVHSFYFLCVKPLSIMVLAAYSKYDSFYTYHELLIMIRMANQMN